MTQPDSLKPPRLQPGDTIGIISPSWGGAGLFPHRVELGVKALENLGFRVIFAPHALNHLNYTSDTPENRAQDIHTLFADPQVKAIIAAIGGDHACQLLPLLDFDLIRRNPKIFMGFSDVTVLNIAIWATTGLTTFNGPALLTDFGEYPHLLDYTAQAFRRTLCEAAPVGQLKPAAEWTDEFLDWGQKLDLTRPRAMQPSPGWTWLKTGSAEGRLVGGCLESLQHLRGTRFWPDWQDTILFFETSEEHPSPSRVDGILMDYQNMGVFDGIAGLLVGRPYAYDIAETQAVHDILLERTRRYNFPIVTGMDFGHTSPQFILPLGCTARIDTTRQSVEITESAVR